MSEPTAAPAGGEDAAAQAGPPSGNATTARPDAEGASPAAAGGEASETAAQVDDMAPDDQIGEDEIADLEGVEVITTAVGDDGTVVIDDLVAEVDASGHVVATDERIEIDLPDGTVIVDETFSVIDESGELVEIEEDTTIISPVED